MKINELTIENFGRFKHFTCNLGDGINIIKGPNEAGKSTIVAAILTLLYGRQEVSDSDLPNIKNWSGSPGVLLKTALSGDGFSAVLEKDLLAGSVRLKSDSLNLAIDDSDRIFAMITGAVGFPSAELFRATACMKQGEISKIDNSLEAIRDKLESLVTGGQQDQAASVVQSKIDTRIDNITNAVSTGPGLLNRLEKYQKEIDYNIDNLERDISNLKTYRNSLAQVETTYANLIEDYNNKKRMLDQMLEQERSLIELVETGRELDELSSRLDKVRSISAKIADLEKILAEMIRISPEDNERFEELESNIRYLRPKLRELEKEETQARADFDSQGKGIPLLVSTLFSLVAIGFSVADYFAHITGFHFYVGGPSVLIFMVSVLLLSRSLQRRAFLKEMLAQKSAKLAEAKKDYGEQTAEIKNLMAKYRISNAEQIRQIAWKRNETENQLRYEKEIRQSALGDMDYSTLEDRYNKLRLREAELKEMLSISQGKQFDQNEINRLKLVVSQISDQKSALENEISVFRRKLETTEGGAELLASYLERKEELTQRKLKFVEELAILGLTKECLEIARQNVMISTLELLENRTSELLAEITDNRYNNVRFDRGSLKFRVFSNQKNDYVDPENELSRATIDQVYLAARLALTEIIASGSKPPLILDEPFERFDSHRLENAMKTLKRLSADRQILILTSGDKLDRYADHIVNLEN